MASTNEPTSTTERMPPRLSTGSVVSFTWLGTYLTAMTSAITASGSVTRNTEPHQKCSSSAPATNGPSEAMAPPIPDQSAIDFVRDAPDHNAVMSASVVGNAIPADRPPMRRATMSTPIEGAHAARMHAGHRQRDAEDQHALAAVTVAECAEPQHRRRQPE